MTLVTQSSLDKILWLEKVTQRWTGPISLTVFAPDVEFELLALFLDHLIFCDPELGAKLAIHVFYEEKKPPIKNLKVLNSHIFNCSLNTAKVLNSIFEFPALMEPGFQKWRTSYPYPQNLARNIARKGANSAYTFVTDIDIVPSENSAKNLRKFLQNNTCQLCAFVIVTYELESHQKFPNDKEMLRQQINSGKARPFHHTVFKLNQYATNFSQ